jgi:hypothetical protein
MKSPVGVAVLPENVFQEHQFGMQAALITQSPVHQYDKYMPVGRVGMKPRV